MGRAVPTGGSAQEAKTSRGASAEECFLLQSLVLKAREELSSPEAKGRKRQRFSQIRHVTGNCRNFHPHPEHSAGSRCCSSSSSSSPFTSTISLHHLPPVVEKTQPASDNVTFCQSAGKHAAVAAGCTVAATEIDSNKCRRGRGG